MQRTVFTIGEMPQAYLGYTANERWNGWACPYFEVNEALEILKAFNECAESPMYYDEVNDTFRVNGTEDTDAEVWKGRNYTTTDGIKHLYAIGNGAWVWDDESDFRNEIVDKVVEIANEHMWYEVDPVIIYMHLKNPHILKAVVQIIRADISDETKFEQLIGAFSL